MSVEADIFNVLKANLKSQLSWVKKVYVDELIVNIDSVYGADIPLLQIFWDKQSLQQPQRGKTQTQADFVIQMIDVSSNKRKTTQQMQFDQRDQVKEVIMGSMTDIKAENSAFIDFSYKGRVYDIHMIENGYLTEIFFTARFNESYGQC